MSSNTNIPKRYSFGFVLNEQELRRLVKLSKEQISKMRSESYESYSVVLLDHSVIKSDCLDDILHLENGGLKSIVSLSIKISDENETNSIKILFQDGHKNSINWNSISLDLIGEDRDWAFLTASELDDRITRLKFFSFPYWWGQTIYSSVFMGLITIALLWIFNTQFVPSVEKSESLRTAYENGDIKNTIEALIYLEEFKEEKSPWYYISFLLVIIVAPISLTRGISWLSNNLYKSYVFYWGDEVIKHDKAIGRLRVFGIAIILGVLASIIAGVLLNAFGI